MVDIPDSQVASIKEQIIQQINSTFPEENKQTAISQVEAMNKEQLVEFLIQNNLIKADGTPQQVQDHQEQHSQSPGPVQAQQCVFCAIARGEMPSHKIDENKDAVATLEINPISKGHTIIIPKEHVSNRDQLPQSAFSLAKKISKKLKSKLKPKDVEITFANLFNHEIINVFPIYKDETVASERYQEDKKVLEKLEKQLKKKEKPKTVKKQKTSKIKQTKKSKLWLPRRIP